jgi:outer membrane protein assembly factor BamB
MLLLCAAPAAAGDWPQWLGPTRDGVSPEKVAAWRDPPPVVWRQPVGEGHSSPVVAAGRVFLHTRQPGKDVEELTAFDAATGNVLWRTPYDRPAFKSFFGNGPRATPAVADGRVYTYGLTGMLTCFDAAGKQLWQVDALNEFKAKNLRFGASCSPLVEGGRVLVNVGGPGASVVAFDKDSGKVAWHSGDGGASYSSPIALGQGATRQIVFLTREGLIGLNPADGSAWWNYPFQDKLFESSTTPVRAGDLLLASSITLGSVGLRLEAKDGKPTATEAWKKADLTCYFSTPVPVGSEHVYIVTGTIPIPGKGAPEASLHCIEARTGKVLWTRPKVGKYHAALLRTGDGKVLMVDDSSSLILLDTDAKEYRELARSKVCGETWAHPALANGRLYLRDDKELLCIRLGE